MAEISVSSHVRHHISRVLQKGTPYGIPCLGLPSASDFGILERGDKRLPLRESMEKIYQEGQSMKAVESIYITPDHSVSFEVFSTIAASPHTIIAFPHDIFAPQWQKTLESHPEFTGNQSKSFIEGTDDGHAKNVPAQLITWVMLKKINSQDPRGYELTPVDAFDFAAAREGHEDANSKILKTTNLSIDDATFKDLYRSVKKHMDMHTDFFNNLFDSYANEKINERLGEIGIQTGEKAVWDINNATVVGHYRGHIEDDGLGGGPQSHPTFHTHTVVYPDLNEIRKRIVRKVMTPETKKSDFLTISNTPVFNPEILYKIASILKLKPDISHEQIAEMINTDIDTITDILKNKYGWSGERIKDEEAVREALIAKADEINATLHDFKSLFKKPEPPILGDIDFFDPNNCKPETVFKQIDPYASVFFQIMGNNISEQLQQRFAPLGGSISTFDHLSEKDGFDMRTSEGWNITFQNEDFESINLELNDFFNHMRHLWIDSGNAWKNWYISKDEEDLLVVQNSYGLPDEAVAAIKQLHPTNKQLERWIMQDEMDEKQRDDLIRELKKRRDPILLQKIAARLQNGGPLIDRTYLFGLTQGFDGKYLDESELREIPFNQGYNIPGLPSFGVTFEKKDGGCAVLVSPIMGLRAMAEERTGATLIRMPGII